MYLLGPIFIISFHIGCLLLLVTGLSLGALLWAIGLYLARMLAITSVYHRLLVHRSYRAPRAVLWIGCAVAASAGQMGPSWWKAHHLQHHRHVDTAADPHTPLMPHQGWRGLWNSQAGWLLRSSLFPDELPADVEADPVLRRLDRLHFVPLLALAALSYLVGGWMYVAAFALSTTELFHGVATVNSLAHVWGDQPFRTDDHSRNNAFVALITLGEGWHNLHHAFHFAARQGYTVRDGELQLRPDPTYRFIQLLQQFGLADQLRQPSDASLLQRAHASTPQAVAP